MTYLTLFLNNTLHYILTDEIDKKKKAKISEKRNGKETKKNNIYNICCLNNY